MGLTPALWHEEHPTHAQQEYADFAFLIYLVLCWHILDITLCIVWLADGDFRLAEELLAKVRQLDGLGIISNISHITHVSITLANVTARLQDLRRHLSHVEDRVHMANSMNTANRRLIVLIQVSYFTYTL